jgi:hypothetical protein
LELVEFVEFVCYATINMTEYDIFPSPDVILQLKNELQQRWQQLPPEHQATMALVLVKDVFVGEQCDWLIDALVVAIMVAEHEETKNIR